MNLKKIDESPKTFISRQGWFSLPNSGRLMRVWHKSPRA